MKRIVIGLFLGLVIVCSLCSMGSPQPQYGYNSSRGGSSIMSFLPLIIIYVLIGLYVRYDNKKSRGLESVFTYKHNKESAYVEYRQWKLVWGLMIDSQKEVNSIIDEWNDNGYTCIGFQRSFLPNIPIIKILIIIIITILTLGFVNYYAGPTLLFLHSSSLKEKSSKSKPWWE